MTNNRDFFFFDLDSHDQIRPLTGMGACKSYIKENTILLSKAESFNSSNNAGGAGPV